MRARRQRRRGIEAATGAVQRIRWKDLKADKSAAGEKDTVERLLSEGDSEISENVKSIKVALIDCIEPKGRSYRGVGTSMWKGCTHKI